MSVGFRCCALIPWMVLAAVLGSVLSLGEDLDRPLFGPPGSPIGVHESDPGLKKVMLFAEERYNRGSNAMHLRKISRFVSATKQLVKGIRYTITVELSNTLCKKSAMVRTCDFYPETQKLKTEVCVFEVWDIPWQGTSTLLKQKCSPKAEVEETNRVAEPTNSQPVEESVQLLGQFKDFMVKYKKDYSSQEEAERRLQIFQENLKTAEKLQALDQGSAEYGVTKFSDLTEEEFRSTYLNPLLSQWTLHRGMKPAPPAKTPAPDSWDWRDHGAVSPVKNQGLGGRIHEKDVSVVLLHRDAGVLGAEVPDGHELLPHEAAAVEGPHVQHFDIHTVGLPGGAVLRGGAHLALDDHGGPVRLVLEGVETRGVTGEGDPDDQHGEMHWIKPHAVSLCCAAVLLGGGASWKRGTAVNGLRQSRQSRAADVVEVSMPSVSAAAFPIRPLASVWGGTPA
uniref:Cathepsin F n=1 Tax=Oryzias sinensis TaxID=183150 RepID=A0A8C7YWI7_9TELE